MSVLASASWRHLGCRLHLTANLGMVDRCGGEGPALLVGCFSRVVFLLGIGLGFSAANQVWRF